MERANITPFPYVRPLHIGIIDIAVGTTNYEAIRLHQENQKIIRLNREANNVETSVLKQLSKTLPDLYFNMFRKHYSDMFNDNLQTILLYLFTTYGAITHTK